MRIKLFRAANMADAMRRVRGELGEDALILGNRRVTGGVEIIAALEPEEVPQTMPPPVQAFAIPARNAARPAPETPAQALTRRALALPYGRLDWSKPVMLVGLPGAGKTATAAKLATRLVRQGERPLVITADRERAGAAEQLAAFTRILGLDLRIAENPLMLARMLANRPHGVSAIIDMAGCNPCDEAQKDSLITHAVAADADLALVLPAGLDAEDAAEMAAAYAALGARHMIPTRLDLTRRLEGVLRAAEAGGFILTDAGIGPDIVDGIIALAPHDLIGRFDEDASQPKQRQLA